MNRVDLLRDIVALLTTVTRDLEPWIEDTVCDNLSNVHELVQELAVFFEHSKQCDRLKLKLMVKVLNEDAASHHELQDLQTQLVERLLGELPHHLEQAPVFDVFSSCPKIRSVLQWGKSDSSELFYNTAIQHLTSPNLNLYKSAVRVLAEGCVRELNLLYAVPVQYRPNILAAIPNKAVAAALFKQVYPSSLIIQTCQQFSEPQMKLISPLVIQSLNAAELEYTSLKLLASPHTLHVQTLLFSLGAVLGSKACVRNVQYFANVHCLKSGVLSDCVEQLEECRNKEATSNEARSEFTQSMISALFHNTSSKDANYITEALLSDCTPIKQYKHVVRLLKSLASLGVLESLLEQRSGGCPHSLPGDAMCGSWQVCLLLSLTTFYTEGPPDSFSLSVGFFAWLCIQADLPPEGEYDYRSSVSSVWNRDVAHSSGDSRNEVFRSFIKTMLNRIDCIEPMLELFLALDHKPKEQVRSVFIESVLRAFSVSDCDMYTRVSILEYLQKVNLLPHGMQCPFRDGSCEMSDNLAEIFSEMLDVVKDEDSMVHIAFFKMLKAQRLVFEKLLNKTRLSGPISCADNVTDAMEGVESATNGAKAQRVNGDVDDIIANLVDAAEVEDAVIIRGRDHKQTVKSSNGQQSHTSLAQQYETLFISLLRFITEDRCDIERLHAGADLLLTILSKNSFKSDLEHLNTLLCRYFALLRTEQSPLLNSVKEKISELMKDGKLPYVDFTNSVSSATKRGRSDEDLHTVLTLLKADPDPDLVCDCY